MTHPIAAVSFFIALLAVPSQAGLNTWTPSLPGARAHAVAIDPTDPAIAFAATSIGVFKTTDRGVQWTLVERFPEALTIAVNPRNPANVVAGHEGLYVHVGNSTGHIRTSVDGGTTWSEVRLVGYADSVTALAFDPSKPATVYAALIGSGVAKSTDGGKTWTVANAGLLCCAWDFFDTYDVVIAGGESSMVYAASGRALYKSADHAATWQYAPLSPPAGSPNPSGPCCEYFHPWNLAVAPSDPARLYVSGYLQPRYGPITVTSRDGGLSWQTLPVLQVEINRIAVDPRNPTTLYAASSSRDRIPRRGVLRSIDGGASWIEMNDGLPGLDVASITLDPSGTLLYASTPDGVFMYDMRVTGPRRRGVRR